MSIRTSVRVTLVLAFTNFVATAAHAQTSTPPPQTTVAPSASPAAPPPEVRLNTITTNPLSAAFGSFSFEYERATGSNLSLFVGPMFARATAGEASMTAFGGTLGLRLFFGDDAPRGGWFSPSLSALRLTGDFGSDAALSAFGYSAAALFGYTWIFRGGFVLSLGGGLQYLQLKVSDNDGVSVGLSGLLPAARLALGYGF